MTQDRAIILQQLDRALTSGLAPDVRTTGLRLRDRLMQPVRVIVTGRRGTGKTTLCTLLASTAGLSLKEEAIPDQPTGQAELVDDWTSQADVILWCAQDFSPTDQAIWNRAPDRLKDHGFLILTKADLLAAQGRLHAALAAMRYLDDAFHGVLPLATLQAIAARNPSVGPDDAAFRASGGAAVEAAILQDARAGRAAVQDSALLFLRRHGSTPPAHDEAEPLPPGPWVRMHAYLDSTLPGLAGVADLAPAARIAAILDHCGATSDGLADLVSRAGMTGPTALCDDIMTVADMIQLMRTEDNARAATDALGLLLQIRREVADSSGE